MMFYTNKILKKSNDDEVYEIAGNCLINIIRISKNNSMEYIKNIYKSGKFFANLISKTQNLEKKAKSILSDAGKFFKNNILINLNRGEKLEPINEEEYL